MAGDPSQTQPQTRRSESPAFREWYVVTGSASALRMTPGLTVGESDSGALALNDLEVGNQWVEFVLADNGEPWAAIVTRDKSLRVAGTTCLRHPLPVGATVRLPNNTLHISRDIRMPQLSGTVVEVVQSDIPERGQDLVGPRWEDALARARELRPDTPAAEIPEPSNPTAPAPRKAQARSEPNRGARGDSSDRTRRPQSAARRRQVAAMAGVLALGAVTVAGVVAVRVMGGDETARLGSFGRVPVDTLTASSPARTPAPAESSGDAAPLVADAVPAPTEVAHRGSGAQVQLLAASPAVSSDVAAPADAVSDGGQAGAPGPAPFEGAETADSRPLSAADAIPPSEPAVATDQEGEQVAQEGEQVAMLPRAEPEPPAPVVLPPVERRSIPPVAETDAQTVGAAEAEAGPETIDSEPDAAVVAEPEEIGEAAQARATELARRRDLRAADLALARGRLMAPPEANAYALYNRVLAVDPGSPEARSGLQSVRQELINRALAQLARADLDDARRTLQAAADAGVNPQLVADLRGEVDYRQRLIDAGGGL